MVLILFNAAVLIVVFSSCRGLKRVRPTSKNDLEICEKPIEELPCNILNDVIQKDGLFSISKETLENDCPKLLDSFGCLRAQWEKCSPLSVLNLVTYVSGVKGVVEELCDPNSALRKDYEMHAFCLSDYSESLMNCTFKAERIARYQWRNSQKMYVLSASAYRCLAHIELVSCVRKVAGEHCSTEAGQLLARLVERSVRPYRLLNCHNSNNLNRPSRKKEYQRLLF